MRGSMDVREQVIPAEWAPQSAIWVGWPRLIEEWGEAFEPARAEIARFIARVSARLPVRVAVGDNAAKAAALAHGIPAGLIRGVPIGDIWLRDTGPVFAIGPRGELRANVFAFNGWGGKFDMPADRETGAAVAAAEGVAPRSHPFILEGGAVDHDGQGTVLTTRECLLNANRNGWSEAEAEVALQRALGARRIIWLERGLAHDHTDGHIDNIARFIGPGRVVCQAPAGRDVPQAERLAEAEAELRAAGLDVVMIPSPGRVETADGHILPASHMNFVFAAGDVYLPVYGGASGRAAAAALAEALRSWRVVPLGSRAILQGGGSFHCITCNVPAAGEAST